MSISTTETHPNRAPKCANAITKMIIDTDERVCLFLAGSNSVLYINQVNRDISRKMINIVESWYACNSHAMVR